MKASIFLLGILLASRAFASQGGLAYICASEDNEFKITAETSDDGTYRKAVVVDEGFKGVYPEKQGKKRLYYFTVSSNLKAKTLIDIRKQPKGKSIVLLTTDPETNHAVVTTNEDRLIDDRNHQPLHFIQTQLEATLTVPSQEIKDQPVKCLVTKYD